MEQQCFQTKASLAPFPEAVAAARLLRASDLEVLILVLPVSHSAVNDAARGHEPMEPTAPCRVEGL